MGFSNKKNYPAIKGYPHDELETPISFTTAMKVAFTMGGEDLEAPWLALRLESTNQSKREQRAQRVKAIGAQFKVPHAIHPCWLMISLVDYTTLSVLVTSKIRGEISHYTNHSPG